MRSLFLIGLFLALPAPAAAPDPKCEGGLARLALLSPLTVFQTLLEEEKKQIQSLLRDLRTRVIKPQGLAVRLERLSAMNDKLVEQTLALGKFSLTLSGDADNPIAYAEALHDLRNLLTTVSALRLHFPDYKNVDPQRVREVLASAEEGTRKATQVLEGLLSGEPLTIRKTTVSPRTLFREMEALSGSMPSNIRLEWDAPINLPSIEGDSLALSRALVNLCTNARHAMPDGGTIRLEARLVEGGATNSEGEASEKGGPGGPHLLLSVSDTGVGIPKDKLASVFTSGFSTRKAENGQGLGLSSTTGVVEKHGGDIAVSSEVGKGTTFKIFLPVKPDQFIKEEVPDLKVGTILVADDDRSQRVLTAQLLGFMAPAHAVGSGNSAVAALQKNPDKVKMVLLDMNMGGLTLAESVRELHAIRPGLKIVVVTGDYELTEFPGVSAVLKKPISMDALEELIK